MAGLRTEYPFVLHKGYVDSEGNVHRRGVMRLATARDEIEPLRDPRVEGPDDPLLTIIVLARVVTELGSLSQVTSKHIEGLFAADLAYLQDFYGIVNFGSADDIAALLDEQNERVQAERAAAAEQSAPGGSDADGAGDGRGPGRRRAAIEEVPTASS